MFTSYKPKRKIAEKMNCYSPTHEILESIQAADSKLKEEALESLRCAFSEGGYNGLCLARHFGPINFTLKDIERILGVLKDEKSKIKNLNLEKHSFGVKELGGLAQLLEQMTPDLEFLSLKNVGLGEGGAAVLSSIIAALPKLKKLDISCNAINNIGISRFAGMAAYLKKPLVLRELDLSNNDLSAFALLPLTSLLRRMPWLKSLDLSNNPLGYSALCLLTGKIDKYCVLPKDTAALLPAFLPLESAFGRLESLNLGTHIQMAVEINPPPFAKFEYFFAVFSSLGNLNLSGHYINTSALALALESSFAQALEEGVKEGAKNVHTVKLGNHYTKGTGELYAFQKAVQENRRRIQDSYIAAGSAVKSWLVQHGLGENGLVQLMSDYLTNDDNLIRFYDGGVRAQDRVFVRQYEAAQRQKALPAPVSVPAEQDSPQVEALVGKFKGCCAIS